MTSHIGRDTVEEIKNSLDLVETIARDIPLHKKNFDDYRGTVGRAGNSGESLIVTPSQQLWHDAKNQCGGDILSWIAYREGLDEQNDFPEILRIAAEFAGIEFEGLTDEDRALIEEGKEVTATLNEVTEIYHQNLLNNPEAIKQVSGNWGFDLEVIKAFKIGYATGADLKHIDPQRLVKAGLIYKNSSQEFFIHRIMFPYLIKGNTVYFIGRRTDKTPLDKQGKQQGKYKKLLTHDNNPGVSKHVNNKFLFGEDNIKGADWVLIAEGVTDAISAQIRGYPVISAVTTSIKKTETGRISKVIGERPVKICLDIDSVTQAGQNGARSMAEKLTVRGNEVSILSLPDPEGKKDYDLNDYFRKHEKEDFDKLIEGAPDYWSYILPNAETYISKSVTAKLKALKKFVSEDLREMPEELWRAFVENEAIKAFSLTKKDAKAVIDACEESRKKSRAEGIEEDEPTEKEEVSDIFPQWAINRANEKLNSGEAFKYILQTWQKRHVGDTNVGENCLCSVITSRILNSKRGLHIKPSGDSGKGKSDAIECFLELLPLDSYITGSMSAKALFYDPNLRSGTIVYSDDADFSEDVISTIKQSTSEFQKETVHRTVVNGEGQDFKIPERVTFWFSAVEGMDDEQLANRFLHADVDSSPEQDVNVFNHQVESEAWYESDDIEPDILICRCIFSILFNRFYRVKIPYVCAIVWNNKENRRNFDKFKDIIRAVTVYSYRKRETVDGFLISTPEDYENALKIYKGTSVNNATNLTDTEIKYLRFIVSRPGKTTTLKELVNHFKVSETAVRKMLNGKKGDGGLLAKVKQLVVIDSSSTVKGESASYTTREKHYQYTGEFTGLDMYESISMLNYGEVERVTFEFMAQLHENMLRVTQGNPEGNLCEVTLENSSSINYNTNNNTGVTSNIEERGGCNRVCVSAVERNSSADTHAKAELSLSGEKQGYPHGKTCQSIAITSVTSVRLPQVRVGYPQLENGISGPENGGYPSHDGENSDSGTVGLLKRALNKFAWDEYHGTVVDIDEFARKFNSKIPEYSRSLGFDAVSLNAQKLSSRGWRL